jgi:hypothetical protein
MVLQQRKTRAVFAKKYADPKEFDSIDHFAGVSDDEKEFYNIGTWKPLSRMYSMIALPMAGACCRPETSLKFCLKISQKIESMPRGLCWL